jgi:superfamily I DNA/RNA helicase
MTLTQQQVAAVHAVVHACQATSSGQPPQHFVLDAVASSGKSSTLVSMVRALANVVPSANILLLQYNQEACVQMKDRLSDADLQCTIHVHTIHSFGLRLLGYPQVDPEKLYKLWHRTMDLEGADAEEIRQKWAVLQRAVDRIRHSGQCPSFAERPLALDLSILERALSDRMVLDHEDAVYHSIHYRMKPEMEYDLVLVDEAQDLNDASHAFLRKCVVLSTSRTVLCAVGDPAQAIYLFRGANPDSLGKLRTVFQASCLSLTCCFRCPRRVVFVASHLYPSIQAAPTAPLGFVHICKSTERRSDVWAMLEEAVKAFPSEESVLFITRNNRCILDLVKHLYQHPDSTLCTRGSIRWAAPGIQAQLQLACDSGQSTSLAELVATAQGCIDDIHRPLEGAVFHILNSALDMEEGSVLVHSSHFLAFVRMLMTEPNKKCSLTLSTIHGSKGAEHDHVVLYQYNLLGGGHGVNDAQERNLLYIAVTRARSSLTFLMHKRTQHVPSALLPPDIISVSRTLGD